MAARASGLHCPFDKNFLVKSLDMFDHTVGHLPLLLPLPLLLSSPFLRAKRCVIAETSEKESALAVEARRRRFVKRMVDIEKRSE